jgi:hypothetical protein
MSIILRLLIASLSIGFHSSGSEAGPVEAGPRPTGPQAVQQLRKADSLLLTEMPVLVRRWTDKCLIEERAGSEQALDCWRQAASALGPYLKDLRGPLIDQVEQLQSTWLRRVEDLQSYRHAAAAPSAAAVVRPVSTRFNQSDQNRLAGTAMCSSRKLGDYRTCLAAPVKIGDGRYQLKLKAECARGSIAAIGVTDERGRCSRRVISLSAGNQPVLLSSRTEPRVLDAILFGKGDTYECYARRHENVSCDAASAQGDSASSVEDLPKKKARTAVRQKIRAGQAAKKASRHADQKPQRRKKVIAANGQTQKRLKKSQAAEKAALAAVADKPVRRKSKGAMCILFGRNCTPNT